MYTNALIGEQTTDLGGISYIESESVTYANSTPSQWESLLIGVSGVPEGIMAAESAFIDTRKKLRTSQMCEKYDLIHL